MNNCRAFFRLSLAKMLRLVGPFEGEEERKRRKIYEKQNELIFSGTCFIQIIHTNK